MTRGIVARLLDHGRRRRSLESLQAAADKVARERPTRYAEATWSWWHWYYETRDEVVAIVQSWKGST